MNILQNRGSKAAHKEIRNKSQRVLSVEERGESDSDRERERGKEKGKRKRGREEKRAGNRGRGESDL